VAVGYMTSLPPMSGLDKESFNTKSYIFVILSLAIVCLEDCCSHTSATRRAIYIFRLNGFNIELTGLNVSCLCFWAALVFKQPGKNYQLHNVTTIAKPMGKSISATNGEI
jgi:hypothetical protein